MKFRTYLTFRSMRDIKSIIAAEDLSVSVKTFTDALGDDVIEVTGDREEVNILKQVFKMIHQ